MHDGQRHATRPQARAQGKAPSGPAGSQEVGCATRSSDDRHGKRRCPRRLARRPETKQAPRKGPRTAAVRGAWRQRPDVRGVTVAEGAPDHERELRETRPGGSAGLDCAHAAAPRDAARAAADGAGTPPEQERVETLRTVRREAPHGVDTGRGARCRVRTRSPRRSAIHQALASCRDHCHRMG